MNRRGFLLGCLAAAAAPAIVRADSLMRIVPRETAILLPEFIGAGEDALVSYSEVWHIDHLRRIRAVEIKTEVDVTAALGRYFAERLDELMADALQHNLLRGVPFQPTKIAKDLLA